MIRVETDASEDWDARDDWAKRADAAVRAAVEASAHASLIDCAITVEVSVKLSSDAEVAALNDAYRGKQKPTNVLSFPMLDAALLRAVGRADGGEALLGDVILAHGVCAREAEERAVALQDHAAHLIVHGTLHLLGYDHETGDADAEAMEETEGRALAAIGLADPYEVTEVQS
ncbi:MAG TPA: rRNA maturation RNase YbeY [Allosphingosinicella sp.]|nr:rRNA maturation RNase YbeY [Allosphingosinicella sp.]